MWNFRDNLVARDCVTYIRFVRALSSRTLALFVYNVQVLI